MTLKCLRSNGLKVCSGWWLEQTQLTLPVNFMFISTTHTVYIIYHLKEHTHTHIKSKLLFTFVHLTRVPSEHNHSFYLCYLLVFPNRQKQIKIICWNFIYAYSFINKLSCFFVFSHFYFYNKKCLLYIFQLKVKNFLCVSCSELY